LRQDPVPGRSGILKLRQDLVAGRSENPKLRQDVVPERLENRGSQRLSVAWLLVCSVAWLLVCSVPAIFTNGHTDQLVDNV
jgi:hypothetical protein